jgi:dolichyl-diphosphooligosaccharide--protein glycosyltransferase/undecaprenyl-diphosphooligosaccharide--protein glycosyltransferase
MILYPNFKHIESYKVPTVFSNDEVKVLDTFGKKASREDYVIAWWDYGYPIRYYADVKTLIDGGKHSGAVNFPVSYILTNPQDVAAKMARLDVEYTEKRFSFIQNNKEAIKNKELELFSNIEEMTKSYGLDDTNDFLELLETDIDLPQKTRDVYIYLPYRMLPIFSTVTVFSNLDLMSGKQYKQPFIFLSQNFVDRGERIDFGRGVFLNKRTMKLSIGERSVGIKRFIKTYYTKDMHLQKEEDIIDANAPLTLIYMQNYHTFLIVDERVFNSLYIQLFVLENFNKKLFEPVMLTPGAKVYKLKI